MGHAVRGDEFVEEAFLHDDDGEPSVLVRVEIYASPEGVEGYSFGDRSGFGDAGAAEARCRCKPVGGSGRTRPSWCSGKSTRG